MKARDNRRSAIEGWILAACILLTCAMVMAARTTLLRGTFMADIGTGAISLTARDIKGYDPHFFYRLMHNLTIPWAFVPCSILMAASVIIAAKSPWSASRVGVYHTVVLWLYAAFLISYVISIELPVGDFIVHLNR